jgi:hypothetical protein
MRGNALLLQRVNRTLPDLDCNDWRRSILLLNDLKYINTTFAADGTMSRKKQPKNKNVLLDEPKCVLNYYTID